MAGRNDWSWRINGLQDGASPTSEEEETFRCQSRGAATLDADEGFRTKGIVGAFQRGHYNTYVSEKKGSVHCRVGLVLAAYTLFRSCLSYKNSNLNGNPYNH